jgi:DNA polymerase-3 subunit epsilon
VLGVNFLREIVLDTETTGLSPNKGDRVVEIGCLELVNHVATGAYFHEYINPERKMPQKAQEVHGLSDAFLSNKPIFSKISGAFTEFIGSSPLVIHNAEFDMSFLNWERKLLGLKSLPIERVIDTLQLAREKFPGSQASLDALCRRFQIDNSDRSFHGALKDAKLLADVYLELIGGRQQHMDLATKKNAETYISKKVAFEKRPHRPSSEEEVLHKEFLKKIHRPIWNY